MFGPLLKLGALKLGIRLDPASSSNPLAGIPAEALAELLEVTCASCTAAIAADSVIAVELAAECRAVAAA